MRKWIFFLGSSPLPQHSIMKNFNHTANLKYFYSQHLYITNIWLYSFEHLSMDLSLPLSCTIHLIFLKYKCSFWPIKLLITGGVRYGGGHRRHSFGVGTGSISNFSGGDINRIFNAGSRIVFTNPGSS